MNQIASPVILDAAAVEKCCHFFDLMRLIAGCNPVRVWPCAATVSDIWASFAASRAHPFLMDSSKRKDARKNKQLEQLSVSVNR